MEGRTWLQRSRCGLESLMVISGQVACLPSLNFSFLDGIQMEAKYLPSGVHVRLPLDTAYRVSGF